MPIIFAGQNYKMNPTHTNMLNRQAKNNIFTSKIYLRWLFLLLYIIVCVAAVLAQETKISPSLNFSPGKQWPDNEGVHINAHGGGTYFAKDCTIGMESIK